MRLIMSRACSGLLFWGKTYPGSRSRFSATAKHTTCTYHFLYIYNKSEHFTKGKSRHPRYVPLAILLFLTFCSSLFSWQSLPRFDHQHGSIRLSQHPPWVLHGLHDEDLRSERSSRSKRPTT